MRLEAPFGTLSERGMDEEALCPEQERALRRLSPEARYRAARDMYWTLRRHKRAFLRSLHPEWSDAELEAEVRRIFLHART